MNPVVKILSSVLIAVNGSIDSLNGRTIAAIRRGFFTFIFFMCIIAIVIGYNYGTKSAKIKSDPLAKYVNDTFKIDINRERAQGDFSSMLEKEIVNESPMNNFNKTAFPTRENLNPELKKEAIEAGNKIPEPDIMNKPFKPETPIDENIKANQTQNDQQVKVIDKTFSDTGKGELILKEKETKSPDKKGDDKNIIKIIDKNKEVRPEPIKKDTGVISK